MPRQLTLDLPMRTALGRDDFVVSDANAKAVAMTEGSDTWPGGKLCLSGPEASGKTHLAHVWAGRTDAIVIFAADLPRLDIPTLAEARHLVVEDVPQIAGHPRAEAALFHLHNLLLADGGRLLFTGQGAPSQWNISLPDLRSRLVGTNLVTLDPPDDALLAALLRKQFADRQLAPAAGVTEYLLARMTRSGAEARRLVAALDRLSLAEKRPVTLSLARRVLEQQSASPDCPETPPESPP